MIQVDFTGATPNIDVTPGHPGVTIDVSKRGPVGPRGQQGPGVGETVASISGQRGWRALRAALATGTARVVAMGDSKTEGAGVSVTADRWLDVLMAGLRARYAPTGDQGLGYLPAYYATFWGFPSAPTTSGSAATVGNGGGLGNRSRHLAAGGAVTWTVPAWTSGVPLLVHWTQHPGLGDLEVVTGGTVRATIATGGAAIASKVTPVTVPAGTTSVTVRHKAGTGAGLAARVEGIVHRTSTTGVIVYDAARSGAKAVDYSEGLGSSGAPDSEDYHWQAVQLIAPHAVILAFGANDQASRTAAQWSDDLRLAVAKAKAAAPGAGVIVLHGAQRTEEAGDPSRVLAFEAAARAAVGADPDVSILYESSLWAPVVGEDYSDGDGIWLSDTVHTNATANQAIARMLLASITSVDGAADAAALVRDAAAPALAAAQTAATAADASRVLAEQAQAAKLEVPDLNVSALVGNPSTDTNAALRGGFERRHTVDTRNYATPQAAAAALMDGDSLLIGSSYTLTSPVVVNAANVRVHGVLGATLTAGGTGADMLVINGSGCVVSDLRLDGDGVGWYGVRVIGDHVAVRDIFVRAVRYVGVNFSNSSHGFAERITGEDVGWDLVACYGQSAHLRVSDCRVTRPGRHGYSADGGSGYDGYDSTDISFQRCEVIDGGNPALAEGHTGFHFERVVRGRIVDCVSRYTANHPITTTANTGTSIPGVRAELSTECEVDGLTIVIEAGFAPLAPESTSMFPWVYNENGVAPSSVLRLRRVRVLNYSSVESRAYIGPGRIDVDGLVTTGKVSMRQRAVAGHLTKLTRSSITGDGDTSFYLSRWAGQITARDNVVTDVPWLISGHVEKSVITDNTFVRSGDVRHATYEGSPGRAPAVNRIERNLYDASPVAHSLAPLADTAIQAVMRDNTYTGALGVVLEGQTSGQGRVLWRDATRTSATWTALSTASTTLDGNWSSQDDFQAPSKGLFVRAAAGPPEGVVTATAGALYLRLNSGGGPGTTLYVKESGTGNTGWVAK